jgi:hypothetical protein
MPICDVCGASFELDGYHVALAGRRYDRMDCALRAEAARRRRRDDATTAWISAAKRRLGIEDASPNVGQEPADL